jgi:hypothetical protein
MAERLRVQSADQAEPAPHACDLAWSRLAEINEALEAARAADAATSYRVLLLTALWRARVYLAQLELLLTELGE